MNERSADNFAALVKNQVALRGRTLLSGSTSQPDKHEISLVSTITKTDSVTGISETPRLFVVSFCTADYDIYEHPLGLKLKVFFNNMPLIEQVHLLWEQWVNMDRHEWVGEDSVLMFKTVGGKIHQTRTNPESLFATDLLRTFYGALVQASQTELTKVADIPKAEVYQISAIRLGGYLKKVRDHWDMVLDQLAPLNSR